MDGFVPVAKVSDLAPGQMKWVAVDRERVLVANVEGTFYALRDACGHQRAPLSEATDVPTQEVQVEGETVYVRRKGNALSP